MKQKRPAGYKAERRSLMKRLKDHRKRAKAINEAIYAAAVINQRIHNVKVAMIELEPPHKRYFKAIAYGMSLRIKNLWREVRRARQ